MIYITAILLAALLVWILVLEIKSIKKSSAIRKGTTDYKVILTRNEELLIIFLLISYLMLVVYLLCYFLVFDCGSSTVITAEMIKDMLKNAILTLMALPNFALIVSLITLISLNRKLLAKADDDAVDRKLNKTLMLATLAGCFIVVAACTACMKYELISPLAWFSILTYGKIVGLGLVAIALKQ